MKDLFETGFNQGLDDAQAILGQKFTVNGQSYEAVSIDKLSISERGMPGGKFQDVNTLMVVRNKVVQQAGLKDNTVVLALGERLRVAGLEKEGDDSTIVLCGPAGVEVPRLR